MSVARAARNVSTSCTRLSAGRIPAVRLAARPIGVREGNDSAKQAPGGQDRPIFDPGIARRAGRPHRCMPPAGLITYWRVAGRGARQESMCTGKLCAACNNQQALAASEGKRRRQCKCYRPSGVTMALSAHFVP